MIVRYNNRLMILLRSKYSRYVEILYGHMSHHKVVYLNYYNIYIFLSKAIKSLNIIVILVFYSLINSLLPSRNPLKQYTSLFAETSGDSHIILILAAFSKNSANKT